MSRQRQIKLEIENFGPIASGSFELRPLTLFIGPNNSGKSYAATLAYSVVRALQHAWDLMIRGLHNRLMDLELDPELIELLVMLRSILLGGVMRKIKLPKSRKLTDLIQEIMNEVFSADKFGDHMRVLIQDHFSCENPWDLISTFALGGTSNIRVSITDSQDQFVSIQISKTEPHWSSAGKGLGISVHDIELEDLMLLHGAIGIPNDAYYLPAARSGIVQGWRALASLAVRRVSLWAGIERIEVPPLLPGLIGQFLSELIDTMNGPRRRRSAQEFRSVIEVLEEGVLKGQVDFKRIEEDHIPELIYRPNGFAIPVWRSASAVGELAPLILWIRRVLKPGDLLIIEEPEAHLHPENQRQVARALVRLVRAGVKVICTTHSSLILHQISNHLLAAQAEPERRMKLGFTESDLLGENEVGVYLFKMREEGNGSEIRHISVEPGFGIPEDEFLRVYEAIGDETYHLTGPLNVEN